LNNPNLIDYQQWQTLNNGNFLSIETVSDRLYAIRSNRVLFEIVNDNFNQRTTYNVDPLDMMAVGYNLLVTTQNNTFVYDASANTIATAAPNADFQTLFTAATLANNTLYIGTRSLGVLQTEISNAQQYTVIRPDGPLRNDTFKLNATNG